MLSLFNVMFSKKKEKEPISVWFWICLLIVSVFVFGVLTFTVFPHIALFAGFITSDQYVTITTKFYEYGFKVIESGIQVIPSVIPNGQ